MKLRVLNRTRHAEGAATSATARCRRARTCTRRVPAAVTMAELEALVAAVQASGRIYMLGETSYYGASTIFCRKKFRQGLFGRFVFAEAGYHHDMEHGFYGPYEGANGPDWKKFASFPPMLYPTHSVGKILGVTGGRATSRRRPRCTTTPPSSSRASTRTRKARVQEALRAEPARVPVRPAVTRCRRIGIGRFRRFGHAGLSDGGSPGPNRPNRRNRPTGPTPKSRLSHSQVLTNHHVSG